MNHPILTDHVITLDPAQAPLLNADYNADPQYLVDYFGQWMVDPTTSTADTSAFQPQFPLGYLDQQAQVTATAPAAVHVTVPCSHLGCLLTFKRDADRARHEASVHGINFIRHFCHVQGCPKSNGAGYKRKDKLTEHFWKKHADLGFVKRV
jgi:transposase-like protein